MIGERDDDIVHLPVPKLDEDGNWDGLTTIIEATTKPEYFELIRSYLEQSEEQSISMLEAFHTLDVCPYAFIDEFSAWIVSLESDVSTYHVLPSGGGIFDEKQWLMDAFRSVRKARDDYYLWKHRQKTK